MKLAPLALALALTPTACLIVHPYESVRVVLGDAGTECDDDDPDELDAGPDAAKIDAGPDAYDPEVHRLDAASDPWSEPCDPRCSTGAICIGVPGPDGGPCSWPEP